MMFGFDTVIVQKRALALVQVTIYFTDIADYAVMNRIYAGYFENGFPTRACIGVKELALEARIEISGIALLS
jgi:2-iminobutanoate/2-iminopropanoate deaminase